MRDWKRIATRGIGTAKRDLSLLIRKAGVESKAARPHETPTKKSRKRKPLKASSGVVKARAPKPSEELELEPKVPDEVQESPIPS